ncbi:MAG: hypothetical protein NT076_04550 [Candidatus Pacearchaeota archaeon]|nr:hypothetical protein [Candidatus Pacearchaeota archaeon]
MGLLTSLTQRFSNIELSSLITNSIVAVILIVIGLFFGWLIKVILKDLIKKAELEKTTKTSFINLFITVVRWSVYLLFISLALDQLGIPELTRWLSNVLVTIPAIVGALILLGIGFGVSVYLGDVIEESRVLHWKTLSTIVFYFVNYIFVIFALRTALIYLDIETLNWITIIFTAVVAATMALWHLIKKK